MLALALKRPETCKEDPARSDSNCLTSEAHNKEDPPDAKQEALVWGPWGFCVKMIPFSHRQLVSGDDSIPVRCGCERCNRRDWPFFFFLENNNNKRTISKAELQLRISALWSVYFPAAGKHGQG